jgi:hypothetical protein
MKKLLLATLFLTTTVEASTWDVLHKWFIPSKDAQTQEIVWNTNLNQTVSLRQHNNSNSESELWSLYSNTATNTGQLMYAHQSVDYADNNYFIFGSTIKVVPECVYGPCPNGFLQTGRTIKLSQPKVSSGNVKINTDGKSFSSWGTWAGATDGQYAMTVSFANVGSSYTANIKSYTHVFLYNFNTSNLPNNGTTLNPIRAFRIAPEHSRNQSVQGAEIANGKVYIQLGGLHNYDNDYKNVILEYTMEGKYVQTHEFEAKNVINTGSTESNNPSYLHAEYEGLMEKNGKIYAQVYYQYGTFSKTHKSVVYEAIDSSRSLEARVTFINKANPNNVSSPRKICIDGEGSTTKAWKKQNVQSFYCDGGPDQTFELWRNGQALTAIDLGFSNIIPEYDAYGNELWFEIRPIYQASPPLCLDASGYSGSKKANAQYWTCENLPDQKWKMKPDGRIINKQKGMCLDISGYSGESNKNMKLWTCDYNPDQSWSVEKTFY